MQDFQKEFASYWHRLPQKAFFFTLLAFWLAIFQFLGNSTFGYVDTPSLFHWMYDCYNSVQSEDGHGNLIPFAVLALFWMKREELAKLSPRMWWPALLMIGAALLFHLVGYLIQQPRLSVIGMFLGIYGLIGLTWGWRSLQATFFPFFLFAFSIPVSSLLETVTFPLRMLATGITYGISKSVLGLSVVKQGTQLFDANGAYSYDVAAACSGIRSLISLFALTTIYGMVTFKTFWKRAAIILVAFPLAVACNVIRLLGIVIAAEAFGQKAGDFMHEWSGFLTYTIAIACVLLLGYLLREREVEPVLTEAKAI